MKDEEPPVPQHEQNIGIRRCSIFFRSPNK